MSEWGVDKTKSKNQELYNNYVKNHPECKLMRPEAIWTQIKKEGLINDAQYKSGIPKISSSIFNPETSTVKLPMVSFSNSSQANNETKVPYAPIKYHKFAKDLIVDSRGKVDKNQYSIDALKKRYNPKDYEFHTKTEEKIDYTITNLSIISKNTQKPVFKMETFSDSDQYIIENYNKQGYTRYAINNQGNIPFKAEIINGNNIIETSTLYKKDGSMTPVKCYEYKNNKITLTKEYNEKGEITQKREYLDNGTITTYYENGKISKKQEHYENGDITTLYEKGKAVKIEYTEDLKTKHTKDTVNSLYKGLYSLDGYSDKEIQKYLTEITPNNITEIEEAFKEKTGKIFSDKLTKSDKVAMPILKNVKYKTLINHLEKCWEEACGYDKNFKNDNSQVKNDWHTGDPYSVLQKGNNLIALNKKTKKISTINLETFLKDFSIPEKAKMKSYLQQLPGEVIADLAAEADKLNGKEAIYEKYVFGPIEKIQNLTGISNFESGGYYASTFDSITIKQPNKETIVHELGHAIDNQTINFESDENKLFENTFNKEMNLYKSKGNKTYSFKEYNGASYCTANKHEMFAECYTLLMTGRDKSQECILEHFPETLKVVEQMILDIRKKRN